MLTYCKHCVMPDTKPDLFTGDLSFYVRRAISQVNKQSMLLSPLQ